MTDHLSIPRVPTLDMCVAYMRAVGYSNRDIANWSAVIKRTIGTPEEPPFIACLRAAIAVGAGASLEAVKRDRRRPRRTAA